jgi:hypothetical protein
MFGCTRLRLCGCRGHCQEQGGPEMLDPWASDQCSNEPLMTWPSPSPQCHWLTTLSVPHLTDMHTMPFPSFQERGLDCSHKFWPSVEDCPYCCPNLVFIFLDEMNCWFVYTVVASNHSPALLISCLLPLFTAKLKQTSFSLDVFLHMQMGLGYIILYYVTLCYIILYLYYIILLLFGLSKWGVK